MAEEEEPEGLLSLTHTYTCTPMREQTHTHTHTRVHNTSVPCWPDARWCVTQAVLGKHVWQARYFVVAKTRLVGAWLLLFPPPSLAPPPPLPSSAHNTRKGVHAHAHVATPWSQLYFKREHDAEDGGKCLGILPLSAIDKVAITTTSTDAHIPSY